MIDVNILKSYRILKFEIYELCKQIEELKNTKVEHDQVTGSNPEFPYQEIKINIEGLPDNTEHIKALEEILKEQIIQANEQKLIVEKFISGIFDSRVRLIFKMRYIHCKSWVEISSKFGSHDESYARKIHNRYLKKFGNK